MTKSDLQMCKCCIYDEKIPKITFDEQGICNYCRMIENLTSQYGTGSSIGEAAFFEIVKEIKKAGKNKPYDCVIGVSGGTDSSYMLAKAVEWGLRPLAVHYDNTWNSAIATQNIAKMLKKLNIDLYTHVGNNKEVDDIFRSFFLANVPELDASTDIALAEVTYEAAAKYGVQYILEGHSFITEGISPLNSFYMDGKYIASIHKKFGSMKMDTFPNMPFWTFMKWILLKRIRKIRPLWYLDYSKEDARDYLQENFGWEYYGGHHLENRLSSFNHSIYLPEKFNMDYRNNTLSALVRMGKMSQEEAIKIYSNPPHIEEGLEDYFKKRLHLSDELYDKIMKGEKKSFRDYPTYKKLFEKLRPLFYILAKANLVPMSFYIKYTSKGEV